MMRSLLRFLPIHKKNIITYLFAFVTLASCSNNPQWADEEAHEKTEQLRKQYTRR